MKSLQMRHSCTRYTISHHTGDTDGDGIQDSLDSCLYTANSEQADTDGDGVGDRCDVDIDDDGIENEEDNCPYVVNILQADTDGMLRLYNCQSSQFCYGRGSLFESNFESNLRIQFICRAQCSEL